MTLPHRILALALLAGVASAVVAQGTASKSIGSAKGGGKLLTREELRACLNQQKDLAARKPLLVDERAALDRERQELGKAEDALKDEQARIEQAARLAADVGRRTKELQQQVADYNERAAKFQNANLSGLAADRQRRALDSEKATIDKASAQLEADRTALGGAEQLARNFNAQVEARNRAVDDWNARNQSFARKAQALSVDEENFRADCEGRSYREDDEKAILSGK